jgi:hypothetical protein
MFPLKWMIPIACVSTAVMAQGATDLNGLVAAAAHYVSSGMASARDPESLALSKVVGNYSSQQTNVLMTTAADVQHWTFLYRIEPGAAAPAPPEAQPPDPLPQPHRAVTAECAQGVFRNFRYSRTPVKGLKSLEYTWAAVTLDSAIANLNANGYIRGFTSVQLERPDDANVPDAFVYVFDCPLERRRVAISCQTGALAWSYGY